MKTVGWVQIFVSDMDRAVEFYAETLGIGLRNRSPEFPEFVELATEGTVLALNSEPERKDVVGRFTGITMTVPDVEGAYASLLDKGVRFSAPPSRQPWGGTMTSLFDPDGNEVSLLEMPEGEP
jgi:predicted enzyme related to lactoylglutathione lyase